MKHNDLYQQTQRRIKNVFPMKIRNIQDISHTDMYSYIVFDITALRERPKGNSVEIARIHSEWQFTGRDPGVERIEIPSAFTEILLQKKHKSNIITCVAVERYLYAGKDARETITTLRMGTIYRGNYRILYQLFVSTDQFLYGEWWKEETQKNTTIKTNNLVYIGQQLIDAANGGYIGGIMAYYISHFFGFERNMFDRLWHFVLGLYTYPIAKYSSCKKIVGIHWMIYVIPVIAILAIASMYEITERLVVLFGFIDKKWSNNHKK